MITLLRRLLRRAEIEQAAPFMLVAPTTQRGAYWARAWGYTARDYRLAVRPEALMGWSGPITVLDREAMSLDMRQALAVISTRPGTTWTFIDSTEEDYPA